MWPQLNLIMIKFHNNGTPPAFYHESMLLPLLRKSEPKSSHTSNMSSTWASSNLLCLIHHALQHGHVTSADEYIHRTANSMTVRVLLQLTRFFLSLYGLCNMYICSWRRVTGGLWSCCGNVDKVVWKRGKFPIRAILTYLSRCERV